MNISNCTNCVHEFAAFGFLLPVLAGVLFSLSLPTIIALCTTQAVDKGFRMFLTSALVSGILIIISSCLMGLIALVTVFFPVQPPATLLCRFLIWVYNIGQVARSFSVVGFSTMVLVVVRYGRKNMKVMYIILSLCIVWGISLLLTVQYQVPQVYALKFIVGSVCLPVQDETIFIEARIFFTLFVLAVITFVPLFVCTAQSVIVFCYLKRHNITGDIKYNMTMTKLAMFLLTGNLFNSTGSLVISILANFTTGSGSVALIYCIYVIGLLSLYPTPILILSFLKPVRNKLKTFLKCTCLCGRHSSFAETTAKSMSTSDTSLWFDTFIDYIILNLTINVWYSLDFASIPFLVWPFLFMLWCEDASLEAKLHFTIVVWSACMKLW